MHYPPQHMFNKGTDSVFANAHLYWRSLVWNPIDQPLKLRREDWNLGIFLTAG
jgi:hypothetical protein